VRSRWREKVAFFCFEHFSSSLIGIPFGDWMRVLRRRCHTVDFPYWPRVLAVTLQSVNNSLWKWREDRLYGPAVAGVAVPPPLFILGHWRNGTTHLHNLLAVDPQFAFPNNYQVVCPHTFLCTEERNAASFDLLLPQHRPQDNVRLGMGLPQEDEFALNVASFCSLYMGWAFLRCEDYYERYLTFRGVPAAEVARWQAAFVGFLKKLTWKYNRPLLLKSPPHTCRIRLLLEMFPGARFVHIHREPFTVFRSTKRLLARYVPSAAFQRRPGGDLHEQILTRYRVMYDAFFEERGLIPPGHYHEMAFEELERDPLGQMRALYDRLGLGGFEAVRPALEKYLVSVRDYEKNLYAPLPPRLRQRIATAWQRCFAECGYPTG
jgi:hypothetical protein